MDETQSLSIALDPYAIAAFVGYLLLLIGIGVYSSRFSSRGIKEYFIGGRKMNRFVVALSAVVSGRSAWLLLDVTGMAYAQGPRQFGLLSATSSLSCFSFLIMLAGFETLLEKEIALPFPFFC